MTYTYTLDIAKLKKRDLLKLPVRKWDDTEKTYDSVLLVPTNKKHESGFMHIAIVGVNADHMEICAYPDDISCNFPIEDYGEFQFPLVRMDCFYPNGVLRYHGRGIFKVGAAFSSVEISFIS